MALRPLLEEAVEEFAGPFEAAGVRLGSELEDAVAEVDPVRIRQVVTNLLSNALKFTPAGGAVRVELRRHGTEAVLRVSDTGPGIPPDELPHVFDRFFRGRGARVRGSGIGLTVARELVLAHGGDIAVESQQGRGTTFTVRLPVAPPRSTAALPGRSRPRAEVGGEERPLEEGPRGALPYEGVGRSAR